MTNKKKSMFTFLALGLTLGACGSDDSQPLDAPPDAGQGLSTFDAGGSDDDAFAGCERGTLEDDFGAEPLRGPGVVDGELAPGRYLFSTTYLRLRQEPAAQMRFGQLMEPIIADLMSREGLVALSLGTSEACGVARTLSVWRDDTAMMAFVSGPAHGSAVRSVEEVSRGGSTITHWAGSEREATWENAAKKIGLDDGPFY